MGMDWIEFGDAALKQAGEIFLTAQDLKRIKAEQKRREKELEFTIRQGEHALHSQALDDAMKLDQIRNPEKYQRKLTELEEDEIRQKIKESKAREKSWLREASKPYETEKKPNLKTLADSIRNYTKVETDLIANVADENIKKAATTFLAASTPENIDVVAANLVSQAYGKSDFFIVQQLIENHKMNLSLKRQYVEGGGDLSLVSTLPEQSMHQPQLPNLMGGIRSNVPGISEPDRATLDEIIRGLGLGK